MSESENNAQPVLISGHPKLGTLLDGVYLSVPFQLNPDANYGLGDAVPPPSVMGNFRIEFRGRWDQQLVGLGVQKLLHLFGETSTDMIKGKRAQVRLSDPRCTAFGGKPCTAVAIGNADGDAWLTLDEMAHLFRCNNMTIGGGA